MAALSEGFCAEAWRRTERLQLASAEHPFNRSLAQGSLSREVFAFYIVQDARYLVGFAQALAAAASRAPVPDDAAFLAGAAKDSLVTERALHAGYVEEFGLTATEVEGVETSPSCEAYTSYLRAAALTEPYPVLLAALLPCFWIYHYVGTQIVEELGEGQGHPYRAWIDTYADEEFAAAVRQAREITDRAAEEATGTQRERMFEVFQKASEYEWMFWDSAWRMEGWPTAQFR